MWNEEVEKCEPIVSTEWHYCIITFLILLIFNIFAYNFLYKVKSHKRELLLNSYLDSVSQLLIQDLTTANNYLNKNKKFYLFKNFSTNLISNKNSFEKKIEVTPYAIYINNEKENLILDLNELRINLNKIFPEFIDYNIKLDNNKILSRGDYNQITFDVKKDYVIDKTLLGIELEVRKNSYLHLSEYKAFFKIVSLTCSTSFVMWLFTLHIHLRIFFKNKKIIESLQYKLEEEKKLKEALLSNKKIDQKLKNLFIKKLTEMYVRHELGNIPLENISELKSIPTEKYLFPIALYDLSSEKIDLTLLHKDIKEFFALHYITTAFVIKHVEEIYIDCTKEVFYQIIFSLIFNLVEFMEQQNDDPKTLEINFTLNDIMISYDSFPLDEGKMVDLSERLVTKNKDIFLLCCRKIFKSLNEHHFKYKIYNYNNKNLIEIVYPLKNTNISKQKKIIEFSKFARKKI